MRASRLQEHLAAFQERARAGAIGLLAAFYFRQAGKIGTERTFEFTHKSFGEYLTARRLVRAIEDIHDDRALNRKSRQRGKTMEEALIRWVELTGPTALDVDLLEVGLEDKKLIASWQICFSELLSDQLSAGLPMHRVELSTSTYHEMTAKREMRRRRCLWRISVAPRRPEKFHRFAGQAGLRCATCLRAPIRVTPTRWAATA